MFLNIIIVLLNFCRSCDNEVMSHSVTCDLQTKVFQGHYLKHEELVELRNISLIAPIDTVHFVWYDYRDYMFNHIKSLPHTGDLCSRSVAYLEFHRRGAGTFSLATNAHTKGATEMFCTIGKRFFLSKGGACPFINRYATVVVTVVGTADLYSLTNVFIERLVGNSKLRRWHF